jgi:hypothetical protein
MKSLTVVDGYPTKKFFGETIAQFITRETVKCNTIQYNMLYLKSENIKHYNTSSNELLNPT